MINQTNDSYSNPQTYNNNNMGTALILDDHKFFGESFAVMLEHNGFVEAAFAFTSPVDVRKHIIQHRDGALFFFIDYFMQEINVLQLINDARRLYPGIQIIIVTSLTKPQIARKIISYKPEGFLSKTAGLSELADCFSNMRKKQLYVSPYIQSLLNSKTEPSILDSFTAKEMEILSKLALGENIEEMAASLNLSRNTIIVHRRNMLAKSGVKSVTALLALAIKEGLTNDDAH